ncbi:helix-turn-helix domain-containing protein [Facklamia miroungae]|uniref:Helix-turn-helix n=1 Tax=Facklamia miroungae TaxID=120956 RepID=A0A1G7T7Z8_9LACT|nr:helix-turn-helix transcriptional regulator [Facklamia miroungae]NKZ29696.1 helix-turn-helix transcriptional regulator [Facklamia miroungae]SDG31154.1 Helix-turn-helix [Facklamia miroungae]
MLKNNIELDVKTKCIEAGITQVKLAQKIKTSAPYVNRVIRSKESIINNTFIKMMETLGYDVELRYIKRGEYDCSKND